MAQRTQKVIGSAGIYEVKSTGTIEVGWLYSSGMIPCNCLHQILKQSLEWLISSCNLTQYVNSYTALQFHRISINLVELLILPASHLTSTRSLNWFVGLGGHPHLGPSQSPRTSLLVSLVGGWASPLKNDGLRQLGLWPSQYMESHKTCSKTPTRSDYVQIHSIYSWLIAFTQPLLTRRSHQTLGKLVYGQWLDAGYIHTWIQSASRISQAVGAKYQIPWLTTSVQSPICSCSNIVFLFIKTKWIQSCVFYTPTLDGKIPMTDGCPEPVRCKGPISGAAESPDKWRFNPEKMILPPEIMIFNQP